MSRMVPMLREGSLVTSIVMGFMLGCFSGFGAGCGGGSGDDDSCELGSHFCGCLNGQCLIGLQCLSNFCVDPSANPETSGNTGDGDPGDGDGDGDGDSGDGDGDSGDGDGDSGDGDGDGDGDNTCDFLLVHTPPNVVFVLDGSTRMATYTLDHDLNPNTPNVSLWNLTISGLQAVLPDYESLMRAGIKRFPSSNATAEYNISACTTSGTLDANLALDNAATMFGAVPSANATNTQIKGASPAGQGHAAAVTQLSNQTPTLPRAIVLIVDGIGACTVGDPFPNYLEDADTDLVGAVAAARQNQDIATHAFGIQLANQVLGSGNDGSPEGNPHVWLNDIAVAGGAPLAGSMKYHDATTQTALESGLVDVLDQLVCSLDLNSLPDGAPSLNEIPNVNFKLDGSPVPMINDCSSGNGWVWVTEGELVQFCGTYCGTFKADINGFAGNYCG